MNQLSNSKIEKLKFVITTETAATLRLYSKMIGNRSDETNFPHKLLLTNRPVLKPHNAFANNLSVNIKLTKNKFLK